MSAPAQALVSPPASALRAKKLYINGEWVDAVSGKTFDAIDPSSGEVITQVAEGDAEDINRAVKAARAAFEGPWSKYTPAQRERVLIKFAELLEERDSELFATDSLDMGFPVAFGSMTSESWSNAALARYYAGWPTKIAGQTLPNSAGEQMFSYTRRDPIGVVGAIWPWNAPRSAVIKIVPALAAGCTVVLKPSEIACLSPMLTGEILQELDLPPGVVNIVPGFGRTAGATLAEHPDVNKLTFTGSTATGQALIRAAAGNLKKLTLELGGKSPDIVFADADMDVAAFGVAMAVFGNTGQMCTAGSRVYVERSAYDDFVARLAGVAQSLKVGKALDPTSMIGPIVSQDQLDRVSGYLETGVSEGGEIVTGGQRITDGEFASGYFIPPTVFAGVNDKMTIAREEIFGPVLMVQPFDDVNEVINRANATPYGLAGGVWTRNLNKALTVAHALDVGAVYVNNYNTFDPGVPFGGHKMSGWGSEFSGYGLEDFLKVKTVWLNYA